MGILDNVKKMADKDKLKKVQGQAQQKIDQAQDKLGSGKKGEGKGGDEAAGGQPGGEQPTQGS
jgi:hypothetical protein